MQLIQHTANDLISQYRDDAITIAMLRASEFVAKANTEEWLIWESVILELEKLNKTLNLNS